MGPRLPDARASLRLLAVGALLFAWDPVAVAGAQGAPETRLGVSVGVAHMQLHDDVVRGLRWSGFGGVLSFGAMHDGGTHVHLGTFRFPVAAVDNRYGHGGFAWDLHVDYGYAHHLLTLPHDVTLALGGRLRWDWALQYYEDFDEEHLYWMNAYELGPLLVLRKALGERQRLGLSFDTSVLSLVSRPPRFRYYKIDRLTHVDFFFEKTHEDMRMTSLQAHVPLHLQAWYVLRLGESARLRAGLSGDFVYEKQPDTFLLMLYTLTVGYAHAL